jgi:hypothetical protein
VGYSKKRASQGLGSYFGHPKYEKLVRHQMEMLKRQYETQSWSSWVRSGPETEVWKLSAYQRYKAMRLDEFTQGRR